MEIDKILLALSESYRKAVISIIVCALIFYPILFLNMADFKNLDWYVQLLFTSGISTTYVGFYVAWTIFSIKDSNVFLLPIPIIACCGFSDIISWTFNNDATLQGFFCKLLIFTFISFALIYLFVCINKIQGRNKSPEKPI